MPKATTFEAAQKSHNRVIARSPIGRTALLNSLQKLRETGSTMVKDEELGVIKYASAMQGILSNAVELTTEPPLTDAQKNVIGTEITGLSAITDANTPGNGMPEAPTDTDAIDTAKKKA